MSDRILNIENLDIAFAGIKVVKDVNLTLDKGEVLALVGESGSGKTMLGRSLLGLIPEPGKITAGSIKFNGDLIGSTQDNSAVEKYRGCEIGLIFQEPLTSLNPSMKIGEQMYEAMRIHTKLSDGEIRKAAIDMLKQVYLSEPEKCLDMYPHEFSGGMRQRIMIASVMMLNPSLLIADEPTTALDAVVQREVLDIMKELTKAHGTSVILVSHDLALVAQYADKIAVMQHGVVVETGLATEIFKNPQHEYTQKLLAAAQLGTPDPVQAREGAPLLQIDDLHVHFSSSSFLGLLGKKLTKAVKGVDVTIGRGEFVGLVGESGSGKSTIGRAIANLNEPKSGKISFDGHVLDNSNSKEQTNLRKRIQFVFQDPYSSLNPRHKIGNIIKEGLRHDKSLTDEQKQNEALEMLEAVGLTREMAERYPHALSGGQRQRIAIARALISKPDLLIADEPVSALDVTVQFQILQLLKKLQKQYGFACLFISHDLHIVEQLCARLYILHKGRVVESATSKALFDEPSHPYTLNLLSASPKLIKTENGMELATEKKYIADNKISLAHFDANSTREDYLLKEIAPAHFVAFHSDQVAH